MLYYLCEDIFTELTTTFILLSLESNKAIA